MRVRHWALFLGLAAQALGLACQEQPSPPGDAGEVGNVAGTSSAPPALPWNGHAVAFTFSSDDGDRTANLAWRQVFLDEGARYTLFIISGQVDAPTRLTAADLNAFHADGFEIGSHSVTHVRLTDVADAQLVQELVGSRDALQALIGGTYRCRTFSYPEHAHDDHVMAVTESVGYVAARNGAWVPWQGHPDFARRAATWSRTDLYEVPLTALASGLTDGNALSEAETRFRVQDLVATKAPSNWWINVYAHFLSDIDADHMRWIVDEFQNAGAWIGTFDEVATYYLARSDPSPAPIPLAPGEPAFPRKDLKLRDR